MDMKKLLTLSVIFLLTYSSHAAEVAHIDNVELQNAIDKEVPIIDVRTTVEWKETGVIKGSHLIMFYDERGKYDLEAWLDKVSIVANKDEPVILICHSGGRSKQLAKYLTDVAGYKDVYNVKKGIIYWIKRNNLTVVPQ